MTGQERRRQLIERELAKITEAVRALRPEKLDVARRPLIALEVRAAVGYTTVVPGYAFTL